MGGILPWWIEHPVVAPFTPESFLEQFHIFIESGTIMAQLIPPVTPLKILEILSSQQVTVPVSGGHCALIRAIYQEHGKVGQDLFMVTMVPLYRETGYAMSGWGAAYMFTGITAPVNEFTRLEGPLVTSIRSFQLSDAYVDMCLQEQQSMTKAIILALCQTPIGDIWKLHP